MIAAVDRGIGRFETAGWASENSTLPSGLREEQQRAAHQVLDSRDFAINLRGAAGTGKTATLHEIDRGLHDAGRELWPSPRHEARSRSCGRSDFMML